MKKPSLKRKKDKQKAPTRITNDTVAEHRERILAGGKRYKYPLQYTRRKLVINAIIIAVVAFVVLVLLGWWQLYIAQNSSTFFYRITQLAPLPVAKIDGENARYSDYLMNYRTSEHYLSRFDQIRPDSEDGKLQLQYKKREALDIALADAYARKIAKEKNLVVNEETVKQVLDSLRSAANGQLSPETSEASSRRVLGLSQADMDRLVRNSILRSEAAFAVDDEASATIKKAELLVSKHKGDLRVATDALNREKKDSAEYGISGLVNITSSVGGIRAADVAKLGKNKTSGVMKSVTSDGYYIVKLLEKNDTQVSFGFLRVPLSKFDAELKRLKDEGAVDEYINIVINQPEAKEEE